MTKDEKEFIEEEREIMLEDLRRKSLDEDSKRDSMRKMAWFSLAGILLFPLGVVVTEYFALREASKLLASMSDIYYISIAAIVGAYFGFTNLSK